MNNGSEPKQECPEFEELVESFLESHKMMATKHSSLVKQMDEAGLMISGASGALTMLKRLHDAGFEKEWPAARLLQAVEEGACRLGYTNIFELE